MKKDISKFKYLSFIRKCLVVVMAAMLIPIAVLLIQDVYTQENINIMAAKNYAMPLFWTFIAYLMIVTIQGLLVEYNDFLMPIFLLLLTMILLFFHVAYYEKIAAEVGNFLGYCCKKETLNFIAAGMGGVIATMVAVAVNRRANAEVENNELTQKGHDDARFQNITENLGHDKASVRISAFYRFYYYAAKD